ncbi:MAG: DUF5317 family protein [Nitriliruptor sp.]
MPFTLTIVLAAVLASYLRGGRLRRLAEAPLTAPWLLFLGLGLQLAVDLSAGRGLLGDASLAGVTILVVSQLLVVAWLGLNRRLPGIGLVALGLLMNAAAIAANGAMPVDPQAVRALGLGELQVPPGKHTLMTDATRLPWLADVLPLPPLRSIVSIGDLFIGAGLLPLTHALMSWRTERERRGRAQRDVSGAPVS